MRGGQEPGQPQGLSSWSLGGGCLLSDSAPRSLNVHIGPQTSKICKRKKFIVLAWVSPVSYSTRVACSLRSILCSMRPFPEIGRTSWARQASLLQSPLCMPFRGIHSPPTLEEDKTSFDRISWNLGILECVEPWIIFILFRWAFTVCQTLG